MRRFLSCLLITAVLFSLCPQTKASSDNTGEAKAPAMEGSLFLKVSSITFSYVGESEDIYLGLIPRELVTWESEDPSIVSVDSGVLTATGVGTTTIRATYQSRQVQCTAGCLAQTPEELNQVSAELLAKPKRLLPEVDLNTPCTYFDDAALVGDSIAYMLLQCESKGDYLGNLLFLARGGASLNGFVHHIKNIYYQGMEMNLEDAIAKSRVKRMYILIGSTDIACDPLRDVFFDNWDILLERIREQRPDVEIVIISDIPQYISAEEPQSTYHLTFNKLVIECNSKLKQYCADNGCLYFDLYYYTVDHLGRMPREYNLDGYHFNDKGYENWMKVMRYYAQYELEGGTLS